MLIEVPAVVVGRGPAPLTVAKMLAGQGIANLLVGHEPAGGTEVIALGDAAMAALGDHRLLDVLAPYLTGGPSSGISTDDYEDVLKHHCIADINVTVYDRLAVVERRNAGSHVEAVLTDGKARWDLRVQRIVDDDGLPTVLPGAIVAAAALVDSIVARLA